MVLPVASYQALSPVGAPDHHADGFVELVRLRGRRCEGSSQKV